MPINDTLINSLAGLSPYAEFSEQASVVKPAFVPVNHLGMESSIYLKSQANSPIGWYSWCEEAFEVAKREDRYIFLNIGYSSSHWCGIMDRQCFMDQEVSQMLNDSGISIRVDREEHPDLENIFTEICKVQTGGCSGLPLNIFLTSDAKPFFCVTWLPKRTTGQILGMTELLPRLKWMWKIQRDDVNRAAMTLAKDVKDKLDVLSGKIKRGGKIRTLHAYEAIEDIRRIFNFQWGGFGVKNGPKFPEYNKLIFLLSFPSLKNIPFPDPFIMSDITLRRIWRGGIHDHLGGGFSSSAVDEKWIVPHFEKLLCDQAMLLLAAGKAEEIKENSFHRLLAEDIIFCVTRDFSDPSSEVHGFFSAIDGDTADGEGRYYLWTEDEIKNILPDGEAGLFCAAYGVLPGGNVWNEIGGAQIGWNILYEASSITELSKRYRIRAADVGVRLDKCRKILLEARDKRYPLKRDNKILMNWNGLMIGALAYSSVVFNQPEWKDIAERNALFIEKNFRDKATGKIYRRWIYGQAGIDAVFEDYACFLWGIVELYKASKHFGCGDKQLKDWEKIAREFADLMIEKFWDEELGGFYINSDDDKNVCVRLKTAEDINTLPSANAFASSALNDLAQILDDRKYSDYARRINECFAKNAKDNPLSYLSLINTALSWKPVKPKPAPQPKAVLTDEELNREEPEVKAEETHSEEKAAAAKTSRRSTRSERSERRSARSGRSNPRSARK